MNNNEKWVDLANSIIVQAYNDYISAGEVLLIANENDGKKVYETRLLNAERIITDCYKFFTGKWYESLTALDYRYLLEKAKEHLANLLPKYKLNEDKKEILHKYYGFNFEEE